MMMMMHDYDALMLQGVTTETAGSSESGFTFNDVILMLILDIFIYGVIAWYATNVRNWSSPQKRVVYLCSQDYRAMPEPLRS